MKHIPNILTLSNLFCGSAASIIIIENPYIQTNLIIAAILIFLSLIFDFFDGFVARAVKASGPLGKELDSLADMVSFGFFPGILMMSMLQAALWNNPPSYCNNEYIELFCSRLLKYTGLLITLFSAYRLAKFNLDEEQSYYFKGLPTPANTLFILSLFYIQNTYHFSLLNNVWILLLITLLFSYLLIANIPLMALKFKSFTWRDNSLIYSFLIICILLLLILKIMAVPVIIIVYIILSIIFRKKIVSNGIKTS